MQTNQKVDVLITIFSSKHHKNPLYVNLMTCLMSSTLETGYERWKRKTSYFLFQIFRKPSLPFEALNRKHVLLAHFKMNH